MTTYLRLTGIESITGGELNLNGTNSTPSLATIHLDDGWSPRVARRRLSNMGNQSPFAEVAEAPPLWIEGTTVAEVRDTLEVLASALDQAELWFRGDGVAPVIVHYRLNGSLVSTPLQAAMVGGGTSNTLLELPVLFNSQISSFIVPVFDFGFIRRGLWLGAEETKAASSVTLPAKMSSVFTTATNTLTPVDVAIDADTNTNSIFSQLSAFLFFSGVKDRIILLEAESGALSEFTSTADSGASGGNVAKASTANSNKTIAHTSFTIDSNARRFQFYALLKNTHATITYNVKIDIEDSESVLASTNNVLIAANSNIQAVFIGELSINTALSEFRFTADPSDSGATLEVDYFIIVAVDNDTTTIGAIDTLNGSGENSDLAITHELLSNVTPLYENRTTPIGDLIPSIYTGSKTMNMKGDTVEFAVMSYLDGGTIWGIDEPYTMTVTRRPAYLVGK